MRGGLGGRATAILAPLLLGSVVCAAALLPAPPAGAYIPPAERLAEAAARVNREAGRAVPLRLSVALHTEPPDATQPARPLATGELLSHPGGRARLELVGRSGVREVHLLGAGSGVRAWRDGARLEAPRALLPPLFLLQIGGADALRAALRARGVAVDAAAMGRTRGHDCFVIGGRELGRGRGRVPLSAPRAALWIDAYAFEVVRFDRGSGVSFRFGPLRAFGERRLPAWIALEEPDRDPLYLEVLGAEAAPPEAGDFTRP